MQQFVKRADTKINCDFLVGLTVFRMWNFMSNFGRVQTTCKSPASQFPSCETWRTDLNHPRLTFLLVRLTWPVQMFNFCNRSLRKPPCQFLDRKRKQIFGRLTHQNTATRYIIANFFYLADKRQFLKTCHVFAIFQCESILSSFSGVPKAFKIVS